MGHAEREPGLLGHLRFTIHCLTWLPDYVVKEDLQGDLIAGLTVGVVLIAQGVAYGMLTGAVPSHAHHSVATRRSSTSAMHITARRACAWGFGTCT